MKHYIYKSLLAVVLLFAVAYATDVDKTEETLLASVDIVNIVDPPINIENNLTKKDFSNITNTNYSGSGCRDLVRFRNCKEIAAATRDKCRENANQQGQLQKCLNTYLIAENSCYRRHCR